MSEGNSMQRLWIALGSAFLGVLTVVVLDATVPDGPLARALLDKREGGTHPWSCQNAMWIVFFIGLGELLYRNMAATKELAELQRGYLPSETDEALVRNDLPAIYKRVKSQSEKYFLPRLLRRITQQIQISGSVDRAYALLNTHLDLYMHEIEMRYSILRYIAWFIPTLGFIGTVQGIGDAMNYAGDPNNAARPTLLTEVTERLGLAFYTTLIALIMAGVILLILHVVQNREERALNKAGAYCLDNFINRYFVKG